MKNKNISAEQVWKDFEDRLAPQLNFSVNDRAVYSHLLRHSRLEGKLRIRFSLSWLGPRIRKADAKLAFKAAVPEKMGVDGTVVHGKVQLGRQPVFEVFPDLFGGDVFVFHRFGPEWEFLRHAEFRCPKSP